MFGEHSEVVGDDRGPYVGLEMLQPFPGASVQTIGALETGYVRFDAGTEVIVVS